MPQSLIDAIIQVESGGRPKAESPKGARGLMQITQPALTDYNTAFKTVLTMDDMFKPDLSTKVGSWYLTQRIPQMLKAFDIPVNLENTLWAYNAGIGRVKEGVMPKETQNYIKKVQKLLKPSHYRSE